MITRVSWWKLPSWRACLHRALLYLCPQGLLPGSLDIFYVVECILYTQWTVSAFADSLFLTEFSIWPIFIYTFMRWSTSLYMFCLNQGFSLELLTFGAGQFFVARAVLCILRCSVAALATTLDASTTAPPSIPTVITVEGLQTLPNTACLLHALCTLQISTHWKFITLQGRYC